MVVIPIKLPGGASFLIVVIEADNLERMKQGDPITLNTEEFGGVLSNLDPSKLQMIIAYEQDSTKLQEIAATGDATALINWLSRGYKFIPGVDGWG
jgi:hypothetical protein